jgi:hypothetical protein
LFFRIDRIITERRFHGGFSLPEFCEYVN